MNEAIEPREMSIAVSDKIRLRFVGFGTRFEPERTGAFRRTVLAIPARDADPETQAARVADVRRLYRNEVAVDVGGQCLGLEGVTDFILDHHFSNASHPCAAAAVLANAPVLAARLRDCPNVWIVTHENPDFDACCSAYLAIQILLGADISAPWARLLADYATLVDNCRKLSVPRSERLHSVFYAAITRGRNMREIHSLTAFFDEVRRAIVDRQLNPLFDALFTDPGPYEAELRLLHNAGDAYKRDLARARKCIVALQNAPDFGWYAPACKIPLLDANRDLLAPHASPVGPVPFHLADGIFLRDPECPLFKEWVRDDIENSSFGQGFTFTAIAYSREKPSSKTGNATDYFFSLDPERAGGAHLYNVWARLQQAEVRARIRHDSDNTALSSALPGPQVPRFGFEGRAGSFPGLFADPWFDGANYKCTILATPNAGTTIPGGIQPDLADDTVAGIVRAAIEDCIFEDSAVWDDFSTETAAKEPQSSGRAPVHDAVNQPLSPKCYRFVLVRLSDRVPAMAPSLAQQVGRMIWPFLEAEGVATVPTDFVERHLILIPGAVVVWNRRGIAIARRDGAASSIKGVAQDLRDGLERTASIARLLRKLADELAQDDRPAPEELRRRQDLGQDVLKEIVQLKLSAAMPEGLALRRFLDASSFHEVLDSIDALNEKLAAEAQKKRDIDLQLILALGTAIGLLLAWNGVEGLGLTTLVGAWAPWVRLLAGLSIAFLFFVWFLHRCMRGGQASKLKND